MSKVLWAAAIYNAAWGAWVILMPEAMFRWSGATPPNYPEIWQCVGMVVGVFSIGYAAAARDPLRHWPIILTGLAGKVFGPIGFISALARGVFPLKFGATLLFNDLIWWLPFVLILRAAWLEGEMTRPAARWK